MRTLLALVASSILIINNGIPDGETQWYLTLLGCAAIGLLWALGGRQERAKVQQAGNQAIDQLIDAAASVRQARLSNQDPHRPNLQGLHDDER